MHDVLWKNHFAQAYQKVRQLPLARNLPPAQWMFLSLENGFLTSEDYLTWAVQFYGLASINDAFFMQRFTPNLYEKYKNDFNWGPQALPAYEWDGVLFVACVDPHSVPSDLPYLCRPLLATYEGLIFAWNKVTGDQGVDNPIPIPATVDDLVEEPAVELAQDPPPMQMEVEIPPPPPPIEFDVNAQATEPPEIQQEIKVPQDPEEKNVFPDLVVNFEDGMPTLPPLQESPPVSQVSTSHSPPETFAVSKPVSTSGTPSLEGFSFSMPLPSAPKTAGTGNLFELEDPPSLENVSEPEVKEQSNSGFEMPDGLDFGAPAKKPTPETKTTSPVSTTLTKQDTNLQKGPIPQRDPVHPATTKEPGLVREVKSTQIPPPPKTTAEPRTSVPQAPMTPPPRPPTVAQAKEPKKSIPVPEIELEEELKLCFAKAYQSYRNLMVLKVSDDMALPFRWDASYKNAKVLSTIELTIPSVFRIATKTQKPFHGPVSANPINDQFFANWFSSHTPAYLTIVPLFFEREVVGLLLGAADEELDRKDSLKLMQDTAHKVEANFGARLVS